MGMRDQFDDLKYLISKDNTSSRGFYLMFTVVSVLLVVSTIVLEIASIMGITTGIWRTIGFAGLPVVLILLIICTKLLSK